MSERKELGKIQTLRFGREDGRLGIFLTLGGSGWGVQTSRCHWTGKRSEHSKWTDGDRVSELGALVMWIDGLLEQAKVQDVTELVGIPIECTFDGTALQNWRILTEVL